MATPLRDPSPSRGLAAVLPLLRDRTPVQRWAVVLTGPIVFGAVVGWSLGESEGLYGLLTIVAILGGVLAGLEHDTSREGAVRGAAGGALFGAAFVLTFELIGEAALADFPDPSVLQLLITVPSGALLGVLGAWLRARYERRRAAAV